MTEQEFNKIESLLVAFDDVTKFEKTKQRITEALAILDRNKQLMLGDVVGRSEQLCHLCNKPLKNGVNIDYCTNLYCTQERA